MKRRKGLTVAQMPTPVAEPKQDALAMAVEFLRKRRQQVEEAILALEAA